MDDLSTMNVSPSVKVTCLSWEEMAKVREMVQSVGKDTVANVTVLIDGEGEDTLPKWAEEETWEEE
eukprot:3092401-Karenia_brevis.AAC.1